MFKYGGQNVRLRGTSPDEHGELLVRSRSHAPLNNLELIEHLSLVSPTLGVAHRQHVQGLGSIVPHVFMAKVLARVGACLTAEGALARDRLRPEAVAILAVLDMAAGSADAETRGVIAASFLKDGKRLEFFPRLRPMLGARLAALAHK